MLDPIADVRAFFRSEEGVSLTESALTLLLIVVVAFGSISVLGLKLSTFFAAASSSV